MEIIYLKVGIVFFFLLWGWMAYLDWKDGAPKAHCIACSILWGAMTAIAACIVFAFVLGLLWILLML